MHRMMESLRSVPWHTWLLIVAGLLGLYLTWRLFRNSQGGANSTATNPNWAGLGAGQTPQGDMLLSSIQGLQQSLAALQSQPASSSSSSSSSGSSSTPKTITQTITKVVQVVTGGGSSSSGGYASSSAASSSGAKAKPSSSASYSQSTGYALPSTTSHLPHAIPYSHNAYSVPAEETHPVTPPVLAHGFIQY